MKSASGKLSKLFVALLFTVLSATAVFAYESNVVVGMKVEGNFLIEENIILLNCRIKEGDSLTPEAVQDDIAKIGDMGYFSYVGAEVKTEGNGKVVVFKVEENAIIGEIAFKGNTTITDEKLKDAMESKIGSVFNSKLLAQDIQHINEELSSEGYLFSKVSDAFVQDQGGKINIDITEGILADVQVEGLKKTKEKVVRRELSVKTGEVYDNKKIVRDLQRLYNLGFFEEVRRDHLPGKTPEEIVLVIHVKEAKTGKAGGGAGYSSLNGLVGFVNASQNNFRGEGKRVYMKTDFGGVESYEVGYFDPWFADKPQSFGLDLYNTEYTRNLYDSGNDISEYEERSKGYAITLGKRLRRDVDLSFRFRDEDIKLKPTEGNIGANANYYVNGKRQTLASILDIDTRDNRFRTTSGIHDTFWVETTGGIFRGNNQYTKYMMSMRRYVPMDKNKKNMFAVQAAYGTTSVGEGFIPMYDMFSIGGSNTVRGYEEREFLGTDIYYINLELRFNCAKNFDIVAFYDTGCAWGTSWDQKHIDKDRKSGCGIGFRIQTPLGPVAIDYGKADDRSSGETYINFGSSF